MALLIASAPGRAAPGRGGRHPRGTAIGHRQGKAGEHEEKGHQARALQGHYPARVVLGVTEAVKDDDPDGGDASKANMGLHVHGQRRWWWWWLVYDEHVLLCACTTGMAALHTIDGL